MSWLFDLLFNKNKQKETDDELMEYKGVTEKTLKNLSDNKGDDE